MPVVRKPSGFVRSVGPRRATKRDLVKRFDELMRNNRGGIVDFPLRYIEDYKLNDALAPLRDKCAGTVSDEELYRGAQLAKVGHQLDIGRAVNIPLSEAEKKALDIQRSGKFWNEPKELLLTLFACTLASLTQGWDQAASGNLLWPQEFGLDIAGPNPVTRDVWIFAGSQSVCWFSAAILGSYISDPISEKIGRRGALFFAATCSFTAMVAMSQVHTWQSLFICRIILGLGIGGKASVVPILESEITPSSKRGRLLVGWQVFVALGLCCGYIASYIFRDNWRHQVLSGAIPAFALLVSTWSACESPRWLIIQGYHPRAFKTLVRLRTERVLAAKEFVSVYYSIQAERWIFGGKRAKDEEEDDSPNPFDEEYTRTSYPRRLASLFVFPRLWRAAIAAMIVMLSQQFSGINIIAFLATNFFSTADLRRGSKEQAEIDSYKLAIGWGAVNTIASVWAYFLVENKEEARDKTTVVSDAGDDRLDFNLEKTPRDDASSDMADGTSSIGMDPSEPVDKRFSTASAARVTFTSDTKPYFDDEDVQERSSLESHTKDIETHQDGNHRTSQPASAASSIHSAQIDYDPEDEYGQSVSSSSQAFDSNEKFQFRGRRFLLLASLGGGAISLAITALCFLIPFNNSARLPMIALFIMIFTIFYSIGAGAIAFLYCAEVFPNEGREVGMSWSTFWNFFGVGVLLQFVPFGINYSHGKLLGIFAGLNVVAFILVFFFVPSTNSTATLEDMSYIFGRPMRDHAKDQWRRLDPRNKANGPVTQWLTAQNQQGSVSTVEVRKQSTLLAPAQLDAMQNPEKEGEPGESKAKDMLHAKGKEKADDPDTIESC